MSCTHFACVRSLLASTKDDNLVKKTLSEIDDYLVHQKIALNKEIQNEINRQFEIQINRLSKS